MDENGSVSSCAGLLERREVLQPRTGSRYVCLERKQETERESLPD